MTLPPLTYEDTRGRDTTPLGLVELALWVARARAWWHVSPSIRAELLAMPDALIDRMLAIKSAYPGIAEACRKLEEIERAAVAEQLGNASEPSAPPDSVTLPHDAAPSPTDSGAQRGSSDSE